MTNELVAWDAIFEPMRQPLRQYLGLVQDLAGDNAQALTLFGAIAAGSFDPERHVARSVLVLERVELSLLRELGGHGVKLGKAHIAAPLIMTPTYIQASLDAFPLELLEIAQKHLTLFGEDYFANLAFEEAHVRLQCERELKAILIGLRQGLLAAAGREKFIGALEQDVATALLRTLRGILWLKGQREARPAPEVLSGVEEIIGRGLAGLRTALDASAEHGWNEFDQLYSDVEALGEAVNAW